MIIENPANLHSETVTTDDPPEAEPSQHVQNNIGGQLAFYIRGPFLASLFAFLTSEIIYLDPASSILPTPFYITDVQNDTKDIKVVPQTSSNSQLPRMFTADETGTITLENTSTMTDTKVAADVGQRNLLLDMGDGSTKDIVLTSQVQDLVSTDDMVSLQVNPTDLGMVMNQLTIKLDEANTVTSNIKMDDTNTSDKMTSITNKQVISDTSTNVNNPATSFNSSSLRDPLR